MEENKLSLNLPKIIQNIRSHAEQNSEGFCLGSLHLGTESQRPDPICTTIPHHYVENTVNMKVQWWYYGVFEKKIYKQYNIQDDRYKLG